MCWNQDISINTFVFAMISLAFIAFTNTFTKYKTKTFENPLVYAFAFLGVSMQLFEFFIWRNLKNPRINEITSRLMSFSVFAQPIVLMLMIKQSFTKYTMLALYGIIQATFYAYKKIYNPTKYATSVGKDGHLVWEWMVFEGYENLFIFATGMFYLIPLLLIGNPVLAAFTIATFITSLVVYFKSHTFGTMWCWSANIIFIYLLMDILLIQPFRELC